METMWGWLSAAASRASSKNISTKVASFANCGRMRLMTTSFWNPAGPCVVASQISAIPPTASWRCNTY